VAFTEFLEQHARKLYAGGSGSRAYCPTERLMDEIERVTIVDGMRLRDIYGKHWRGLDTIERLRLALDPLISAGWARIEKPETGGRPTEVLRLHPRLRRE
jgi:hypothetical protein